MRESDWAEQAPARQSSRGYRGIIRIPFRNTLSILQSIRSCYEIGFFAVISMGFDSYIVTIYTRSNILVTAHVGRSALEGSSGVGADGW